MNASLIFPSPPAPSHISLLASTDSSRLNPVRSATRTSSGTDQGVTITGRSRTNGGENENAYVKSKEGWMLGA
ncbi:hypothetical protein OJAV_G00211810 [Oryzias javanicus]|uniref:Uncharacterized protein n=1 Tax=Oryzias javanicus TaxID=123683 RepID=A0A3S2MDW4_ORYJA|nr:hypothetical protein OJAV_G00211810 [Oryzias javanicus]